ncbi:hypothetical protein CO178_00400 [candidate division WWE3 bacterium CG_4_9_14_3_um_filter_34_6]|uniref:Solute-binding protein family 5 domain-containing protein n=1 Tax=candidate division WWE3 bacterium CG_4_9_14_3_um_filter_34_6 TaxID=1975079 RepID=A0A2M7X5C3_UNCKA|nr:MAG: hypothetical protein CO178_00400 [candidate division WWE3 bacterium CG_4_9_14_3_um_filter_34_6]
MLSALKVLFINILLALTTLIPQETLSIGIIGQPTSFLPSQATSDSERLISQIVFRSLFKFQDGELVNDLVDKWSTSEDIKTYKIVLKENIFWQDGTPITSNDILYSLSLRENLINEMEIEKISSKEVQIKLSTATAMLPSILTFGIEPSHLRNQNKISPVGSTSYRILKIEKERSEIKSITLQSFEKNKQYNRIIVRFYNTDNDLVTAYKLGEIKTFLSQTDINLPNVTKTNLTFLGRYFLLVINTQKPALQPIENREILVKSLDLNSYLLGHYYETSLKAQGPISHSEFTKEEGFEYTYDSKATLSISQKNTMSKLSILLPNNTDGRQMESVLKEFWGKQLGIDLQFEFLNIDEITKRGSGGEFDILLIGHEITPDPDRYIFWHSTQIGKLNMAQFEDLRADKALEEGRRATSAEDRLKHYSIFQDVISTKIPAIFLYHPGSYFYVSEKTPVPLPNVIYYPSDILNNL